ncbi:MAG: hypothetical protein OEW35_06295 [Gammaproteobacteria bacterium]|nr:hypothetical protein [Gammaproteobacteria bacterium]MDH4253384.1 hypothetical protein [Gammaproteobacteria bacterium]MDH5310305.1 hypothetical protein [Gammaproteobacteria bacterium]
MKRQTQSLVPAVFLAACGLPALADSEIAAFGGEGSGRSEIFTTAGPWMLDWSLSSDFPTIAKFELRLHDGSSGALIGSVIEVEGTGQGSKLFADAGEYQLAVVASSVRWDVRVSEVDEEMAARVVRESEGRQALADRSAIVGRRVGEGTFESWRPIDDSTLLLFGEDGNGFRIAFDPPCMGLTGATALSFVTARGASAEEYDSILLDDGTRCYFGAVVPSIVR